MQRQEGYYWVNWENTWYIGQWKNGIWRLGDSRSVIQYFGDRDFIEIGHRIPSNEELIAKNEEVNKLVRILGQLAAMCLASDFNEHWDAFKNAEHLLSKYKTTHP